MHLTSNTSDDRCRGSRLHVDYYYLADDLSRHGRTAPFDFARGDRFIAITTFRLYERGRVFSARCYGDSRSGIGARRSPSSAASHENVTCAAEVFSRTLKTWS